MDVSFAQDRIHFVSYDFPGATVHPAGVLAATQIRDADWRTAPPEIRTTRGETLFVPATQQAELEQFCHRNNITRKHRPDIWADLLEPFLDTSFDPEHEHATDDRLRQAGLSEDEVADIRRRLTPLMRAYNVDSMLWDWTHLGLYDLLSAALGDSATLYTWAMEIAERHR